MSQEIYGFSADKQKHEVYGKTDVDGLLFNANSYYINIPASGISIYDEANQVFQTASRSYGKLVITPAFYVLDLHIKVEDVPTGSRDNMGFSISLGTLFKDRLKPYAELHQLNHYDICAHALIMDLDWSHRGYSHIYGDADNSGFSNRLYVQVSLNTSDFSLLSSAVVIKHIINWIPGTSME